jgi:hypothetical protein
MLKAAAFHKEGLGVAKDPVQARKWLNLAAEQGHSDAKYRLRVLRFRTHPILKWRDLAMTICGYSLLLFHGLSTPFVIHTSVILAFLGILIMTGVVFVLGAALLKKFGITGLDEMEAKASNDRFLAGLKKQPWKFLTVPAEDGLFLVPLLYTGINVVSAGVASILFAVAHYPSFPLRYCIPKGVAYFFVALFILPYGIWSVIAAHLLLDVAIFALLFIEQDGKPTCRRLLRAMGMGSVH